MSDYGTVEYRGKTLTLTQQAYSQTYCGFEPVYEAHAVDIEGNEYKITWEMSDYFIDCLNNWQEDDDVLDEGDACDWTQYTVKEL